MTTRYIDLNASQASKINATNNRYTYKLNKTLELPTGTSISVQNSLINLQGITGQSIELEKDFEETIIYNYYLVDTFYADPKATIPPASESGVAFYELYDNAGFRLNAKNTASFQMSLDIKEGLAGFSENIMPLAGYKEIVNATGTGLYLVPMIGKADIKIPKGIYSVSSLADLITDQINAVSLPNTNENFLDIAKKNNQFNGMLVNNTTNKIIACPTKDSLSSWASQTQPSEINNAPPFGQLPVLGALSFNDATTFGAFACKPNHMEDLFYQARLNAYDATLADNPARTRVFKESLTATPDPERRYGVVFTKENQGGSTATDNKRIYDLFQRGTAVGTSTFNMSYKNSGYAISHLHEPRRIPTNDNMGNQLQGSSQEAFFMKRVATPGQVSGTDRLSNLYEGILLEDDKDKTYNTLSAPAQQYSGILVFNWAYQTALKNGNVALSDISLKNDANSTNLQEFWNFEDFFKTTQEAKKAWESTLWFRMGFTYEQIQKKDNFKSQYWYGETHKLNGSTTFADVDSTALPFMSSIYNNYSRAAETKPAGEQGVALPAVSAVQLYNLMDSNVPPCPLNNNLKKKLPDNPAKTLPINVYSYTASNYREAVSIPVQTAGLDIIASDLPRLSINGYMLCLSDIINQDDQAGDLSDCGILDLIPKSSLSNQDFIADRNLLVHTLSNPKTVNYVNINILNPDLTDISLEPNTTILLKIITPTQKPTILMADSQEEIAEEQVKQEQANLIQQQEKQLLKQTKKP